MKKRFISIIPIFFALGLNACNASLHDGKTYGEVIKEDLYMLYKDFYDLEGIKASQIIIERSYICVNDVICFSVPLYQDNRGILPGVSLTLKYDEIEVLFPSYFDIPYVWENHTIKTLSSHFTNEGTLDCYSKDDFATFKNMYENNINDFSFLDRPYSEK